MTATKRFTSLDCAPTSSSDANRDLSSPCLSELHFRAFDRAHLPWIPFGIDGCNDSPCHNDSAQYSTARDRRVEAAGPTRVVKKRHTSMIAAMRIYPYAVDQTVDGGKKPAGSAPGRVRRQALISLKDKRVYIVLSVLVGRGTGAESRHASCQHRILANTVITTSQNGSRWTQSFRHRST